MRRHGSCVDRSVFLSFWAEQVLRSWLTSASHGPGQMRLDDRYRGNRQDSCHGRSYRSSAQSCTQCAEWLAASATCHQVSEWCARWVWCQWWGVQYRLQMPSSVRQSAIQDCVAVIHLAANQCVAISPSGLGEEPRSKMKMILVLFERDRTPPVADFTF